MPPLFSDEALNRLWDFYTAITCFLFVVIWLFDGKQKFTLVLKIIISALFLFGILVEFSLIHDYNNPVKWYEFTDSTRAMIQKRYKITFALLIVFALPFLITFFKKKK